MLNLFVWTLLAAALIIYQNISLSYINLRKPEQTRSITKNVEKYYDRPNTFLDDSSIIYCTTKNYDVKLFLYHHEFKG